MYRSYKSHKRVWFSKDRRSRTPWQRERSLGSIHDFRASSNRSSICLVSDVDSATSSQSWKPQPTNRSIDRVGRTGLGESCSVVIVGEPCLGRSRLVVRAFGPPGGISVVSGEGRAVLFQGLGWRHHLPFHWAADRGQVDVFRACFAGSAFDRATSPEADPEYSSRR